MSTDEDIYTQNARIVLLGVAQDGGVPQCGCNCPRCMAVLNGSSPELYPVSLGISDEEGKFHLIEASRTLSRQLHLWGRSLEQFGVKMDVVSPITSVSVTHLHLGHIDGLGLFGREVMGCKNGSVRLIASKPVIDELGSRAVLDPFSPEIIEDAKDVQLGKGVTVSFHRVPHREEEVGETHGIVIRGKNRSLLFLPDHDTYSETLEWQKMESLREWLKHLSVDLVMIDGTFFTAEEVAGRRCDSTQIPHPPISQSLSILGERRSDDPDIIFVHLNHTNRVIDDPVKQAEVEKLGWKIGQQGQVFEI
mmetsp:Transcript_14506/g.17645  ORF Transcript_14506/g.17645 Transcript_14506/m.17645 type:complete len:306 (+) Transcript_14506:144-1061(+)